MMRLLFALSVLLATGGPAQAHVGQHTGFTVVDGFLHPLLGVDHLAAMLAVGLWSAQGETRRQIAWPLAFVAAMLVGGTLGRSGVAVPFAEPVIAASLLIFGMLVLLALRAPISAGALLVAAFAMAHGYAHGVEAPAAGWMAFAMGFTIATVLIHAVGIGIGRASAALGGVTTLRALGLVPVAVGVATLLR